MQEGRFREDLFYRLNVIPITIPPLRQRRNDIPHLVRHFIKKYSLLSGKNVSEIDDEAMDILLSYNWPGNVRELENAIEYAFARTKESIIHASKLPPNIRIKFSYSENNYSDSADTVPKMDDYLKVKSALEKHKWNRSDAATELRMGRTTLWRKMKQLGLSK
jgi:two-component system response regulator AtoC